MTSFVKKDMNNLVPPIFEIFVRQVHAKRRFNLLNDVDKVIKQLKHCISVSIAWLLKRAVHCANWLAKTTYVETFRITAVNAILCRIV